MSFDVDAYLRRVRLPARVTRDAAGLNALHRAHRLAIPFENLDIRLGRGIAIGSDAVFDKLVTQGRGGYCFEHDRLFGDALDAFGFSARPLLARVWLGVHDPMPLTHTLSLVDLGDEGEWIADAGFGGAYTPPMRLVAGERVTSVDGASYWLEEDAEHGWMLWREGDPRLTDGRATGSNPQRQYSFLLRPVYATDLAMGNHWTATEPSSRFVNHCIVSIVLPNGFAALTDRNYRRIVGGQESVATIDDPRVYRMRLGMMFGIDLSADEVAQLGLFAAG